MAKNTVNSIKNGDDIYVSMGVRVAFDECSICNNKAKTRKEYCDHLRHNMKKILPDGRQVYAKNPGPLNFFDISIVTRPADKAAFTLQKAAAEGATYTEGEMTSAELGEEYDDMQAKIAAVEKFSEIVKQVDGDIVDGKDENGDFEVLRKLKKISPRSLDYPVMDFDELEKTKASPGAVIRIILSQKAAPSLGEIAYASGKHHLGDDFKQEHMGAIFRLLPKVLELLKNKPEIIDTNANAVLNDYDKELEDSDTHCNLIEAFSPKISRRIVIIKQACGGAMEKEAADLSFITGNREYTSMESPRNNDASSLFLRTMDNQRIKNVEQGGAGMMESFTIIDDKTGKTYKTNRMNAMNAQGSRDIADILKRIIGAAVGTAAIGTLMSDKNAMHKMLTAGGMGLIATKLLSSGGGNNTIKSQEGVEIPSNTPLYEAQRSLLGESLQKTGAARVDPNTIAPLLGMAIPMGLGLDYAVNKHVRFKNDPYRDHRLTGIKKYINEAGKFVYDHPLVSLGVGGVAGGVARAATANSRANSDTMRAVAEALKKGKKVNLS